MQINYIRKSDASPIRQTRKWKYDEFRLAVEKPTGDNALFITGVKASSLYSATLPHKISVVKATYNGEDGYLVSKAEQDGN